jgi:Berberine and berberine like
MMDLFSDIITVMLLSALWPNSTFDEVVEKGAEKMTQDIACIAEEMGLLHEFQYINYADPSQDPIGGYGTENVEFLRQVSRKYDPKGIWQRQVPGGFKLGLKY